MVRESGFPQRRSIRLRAFDYRAPGCYVVTICTQHRVHLFGTIVDGEMHRSPAGSMVQQTWDEIPAFYPNVDIDTFIVMPNHVHGIIVLPSTESDLYPTTAVADDIMRVGATPCGCPSPPQNRAIYENPEHELSLANIDSFPDVVSGQKGQPQGLPLPMEQVPGATNQPIKGVCRYLLWCIGSKH